MVSFEEIDMAYNAGKNSINGVGAGCTFENRYFDKSSGMVVIETVINGVVVNTRYK